VIFRGSPLRLRDKWRERPAPLFTEGPRAEVARGGTPSVGGPRAELKLMDKGRQPRNFRRINRAVLLCVIEVFFGSLRTLVSFDSSLPRISGVRGTFLLRDVKFAPWLNEKSRTVVPWTIYPIEKWTWLWWCRLNLKYRAATCTRVYLKQSIIFAKYFPEKEDVIYISNIRQKNSKRTDPWSASSRHSILLR